MYVEENKVEVCVGEICPLGRQKHFDPPCTLFELITAPLVASSSPVRSALSALSQRNCIHELEHRSQRLSPGDPTPNREKGELSYSSDKLCKTRQSTTLAPFRSGWYSLIREFTYPWKQRSSKYESADLVGAPLSLLLGDVPTILQFECQTTFLGIFPGIGDGLLEHVHLHGTSNQGRDNEES